MILMSHDEYTKGDLQRSKEFDDFSWLQQHSPMQVKKMYEDLTESIRAEIQSNALTGKERAIVRFLRPDHVDISVNINLDPDSGVLYVHPQFEYEMHMIGKNWRPEGNLRLDAHEKLGMYQVESIISRMQANMRIILADILIAMGIQDVSILCSTQQDPKDPLKRVATWDQSLPAQLYQLHTNICAGTLLK